MKNITITLLALFATISLSAAFQERDGFVEIEAEDFESQTKSDVRKWYIITPGNQPDLQDIDENHAESASGKAYIEILPDTRWSHDEKLITGENFSNDPGIMGILHYPVQFETPGRYWVWASAFSTGPEDNGLHIGINGTWPESGRRIQWCQGKHKWTWSSAQRVEHHHCGFPKTIYIDVEEPGLHTISLSMREDGVEIDRFILVNDKAFEPEGFEMPDLETMFDEQISRNGNIRLGFNNYEIKGKLPYYRDLGKGAYAIDASSEENRKGFAAASTKFPGPKGKYTLRLKALTEIDGESTYRVILNNDTLLMEFQNPETKVDLKPNNVSSAAVELKKGDIITVESNAHTNGKIPERGGTAWARGRWQNLTVIPVGNTTSGH